MQTPRLQALASRFSAQKLRTSFRRQRSSSSTSTSSTTSSASSLRPGAIDRSSYCSTSSATSPVVGTINSVIFRQPSIVDLEEERKSFGSELNILEPRPIVYWGSFQDRMGAW